MTEIEQQPAPQPEINAKDYDALKKKVEWYESRKAHQKYQLNSIAYIFTALLLVFTFTTALQDATKWEKLGAYTEQLDSCVQARMIPNVTCRAPMTIMQGTGPILAPIPLITQSPQ